VAKSLGKEGNTLLSKKPDSTKEMRARNRGLRIHFKRGGHTAGKRRSTLGERKREPQKKPPSKKEKH